MITGNEHRCIVCQVLFDLDINGRHFANFCSQRCYKRYLRTNLEYRAAENAYQKESAAKRMHKRQKPIHPKLYKELSDRGII